ncbi:hypothetical protein [Legionella cardiaca]|uniref:Ankyrin repeat-containing protein n=1 Tax=Legionella cardiaca TaxID=1071983 RepID=A0ABY8ANV4_9GAMM|nr:hypothetical protein [Legionella cardiaca]WED42363.1 hypothetical protein PXX05_10585 [Legionella cardiaca]
MPNRWEGQDKLIQIANSITIGLCNEEYNIQIPLLSPTGICHLLCKLWSESIKHSSVDSYFTQLELITDPGQFLLKVSEILKKIHSPPVGTRAVYSYERNAQSIEESSVGMDQQKCFTELEIAFQQENTLVISTPIHSIGMHKTSTGQYIVFDPNETFFSDYERKMGGKVFATLQAAVGYLFQSFNKAYNDNSNEFYFEFNETYSKPADEIEKLFNAIKFGEVEEFRALINQENIEASHSNLSLLEFAIMWDRPDFIPILLQYGVDPKKTNADGMNALELASDLAGDLFVNTERSINYLLSQNFTIDQISRSLNIAINSNNMPAIKALVNYVIQLENIEEKLILVDNMLMSCNNNNTCLNSYHHLGIQILLSIEANDPVFVEKLQDKLTQFAAIKTSDTNFIAEFSLKLVIDFLNMPTDNPRRLTLLKTAMTFVTGAIEGGHPKGLPYLCSFAENILDACNEPEILKLCYDTLMVAKVFVTTTAKGEISQGFFSHEHERKKSVAPIDRLGMQLKEKIIEAETQTTKSENSLN